ncbi:hypothetical protein D3C71_2059420 [compost metagenome]
MFMDHQLMAEEIEVDPLAAGTTLLQAEHGAVEGASSRKVIDGNGEVEGRKAHRRLQVG